MGYGYGRWEFGLGECVLAVLLLVGVGDQGSVDVWQDTSVGYGGANESVELFVTADGELEMSRRDTLDFQVLGGVACELQDFGGQVLEHCCGIDGGCKGAY